MSLKHRLLALLSHGTLGMVPAVPVEHKEAAEGQTGQDRENEKSQTRGELSRSKGHITRTPAPICGRAMLDPVAICSPYAPRDDAASAHGTRGSQAVQVSE